jgi:hypothetical protein
LTLDEFIYAGGNAANNTNYYLMNSESWWTMTPSETSNLDARVFVILNGRHLGSSRVYADNGVRPVINLKSSVQVITGDGTKNSPYTILTIS